jgi:hypothetical protein
LSSDLFDVRNGTKVKRIARSRRASCWDETVLRRGFGAVHLEVLTGASIMSVLAAAQSKGAGMTPRPFDLLLDDEDCDD